MDRFQELQKKHIDLLRRYESNKESADFLKDVQEYTQQVLTASREINDSRERNQLRANLRFWGAYIYDHTGTYPNLTLLPSEGRIEAPPPRKTRATYITAASIGGIIIVSFVLLTAFFLLRGIRLPYSTAPASTNTPINPTSLFATSIGGTPVLSMSDVANFGTSTALAQTGTPQAVATQTPAVGVTPQDLSATPTPLAPINLTFTATATLAGGYLDTSSIGFAPHMSYSTPECTQREIMISWRDFDWDTGLLPGSSEIGNAVASLSLPGSGEIISQANIIPNGESTILGLSDPTFDQSYFLQVKHSTFLFQPIIIQFTSDCTYNRQVVTYSGRSGIINQSTLDIDFTLVDWGPNSLNSSSEWIAEVLIKQNKGGIFTYNHYPIVNQTFLVKGFSCSSEPFTVGRTSNGKYQEVVLSLYVAGPLCPKTD